MTKEIKFTVSDKMYELFEGSCLHTDSMNWARELFLQGLAAACQVDGSDETARKIEVAIETLRHI